MLSLDKELNDISFKVIGCAYEVFNNLGSGYQEKDYQKALNTEIWDQGMSCILEAPIKINYKGIEVIKKRADLLVADKIIIELKVNCPQSKSHIAQLSSYLNGANKPLGLIMYFNQDGVKIKRVIKKD